MKNMKAIKLLVILTALLLLASCGLLFDNEHEVTYWIDSFNFEEGETYNLSNPMWLRSGDFTIPKNCTLRFIDSSYLSMSMRSHLIIEEGAVLELRDSLWLTVGWDCKLTVNGTSDNPVIFRNIDTTSKVGWGGIYLVEDSDSTGSKINYAVIDGAITGIQASLKNDLILEGTVIKNCKKYGLLIPQEKENNGNIIKYEGSVVILRPSPSIHKI